jgi:hypothetical protein
MAKHGPMRGERVATTKRKKRKAATNKRRKQNMKSK